MSLDVSGRFADASGYLNTASFGLPPDTAWTAFTAAAEGWRDGRAQPQDYDATINRARAVFARLLHVPESWVAVGHQASPMIGHPADLLQLADGRLLCSYGLRSGIHSDPGGIRATFSEDNGETWQIEKEVRIRKDFLNIDIGYPESMQMPDGRILTVYYFNMFGRYFLGQTVWKP